MIKASWVLDDSVSEIVNLAVLPFTDSTSKNIFSVASNSTISDLAFNSTNNQLSFIVTGATGTSGYTDVTIAKSLINDITQVRVLIDGVQVQSSTTETTDSWLLHFTYPHSTHEVTLQLGGTSDTSTSGNQYILYAGVGVVIAVVLLAALLVFKKRNKRT
jgi:LPXTG-motif cell wall-anchored protein